MTFFAYQAFLRRDTMQNLDEFKKAGDELCSRLSLSSYPIAITFIRSEKEIPGETYRPSADGKNFPCARPTH